MLSDYFSFVRIRIFALAYITCLSILTFAIDLFALPTVGGRHTLTLAVIAIISFIVGIAACGALLVPKTQCFNRGTGIRTGMTMYVGVEVLCSIASLLLLATAVALEAGLGPPVDAIRVEQGYSSNGHEVHPHAVRTLSALLLLFTCSSMVVATLYTGLTIGLAIHTHRCTQTPNVWFADIASQEPAFVYPPALHFLRSDGEGDTTEAEVERSRRSQRVGIEQLDVTPTLRTLLRQIRSSERSQHTLAPDCTCGEKLSWGPSQPDEYRAVGQIYTRVWRIIAEREAQERARTLGRGAGRQRSWSIPVPILRLPTERERRRTMFLVAFDAARLEQSERVPHM